MSDFSSSLSTVPLELVLSVENDLDDPPSKWDPNIDPASLPEIEWARDRNEWPVFTLRI
jgi:hypothetical protein